MLDRCKLYLLCLVSLPWSMLFSHGFEEEAIDGHDFIQSKLTSYAVSSCSETRKKRLTAPNFRESEWAQDLDSGKGPPFLPIFSPFPANIRIYFKPQRYSELIRRLETGGVSGNKVVNLVLCLSQLPLMKGSHSRCAWPWRTMLIHLWKLKWRIFYPKLEPKNVAVFENSI